jgi:hypothetical protein
MCDKYDENLIIFFPFSLLFPPLCSSVLEPNLQIKKIKDFYVTKKWTPQPHYIACHL